MKTMRDNTGHDVPVKYVSKYDRLRDEKTKRVLARFRKARAVLEAVVRDSLADIAAIQEARDTPVAEKGNFSVTSFDGLVKVAIDQAWHIELDDRVKEARETRLRLEREADERLAEERRFDRERAKSEKRLRK